MSARARLAAGLAGTLALACAGSPAQLGAREPIAYDQRGRVDYAVTECGAQVLLFLPLFTNDRVGRAMALIQERAGNRYIADVRLRERWLYLVFGTIDCTDVIAATYPRAAETTADAP